MVELEMVELENGWTWKEFSLNLNRVELEKAWNWKRLNLKRVELEKGWTWKMLNLKKVELTVARDERDDNWGAGGGALYEDCEEDCDHQTHDRVGKQGAALEDGSWKTKTKK